MRREFCLNIIVMGEPFMELCICMHRNWASGKSSDLLLGSAFETCFLLSVTTYADAGCIAIKSKKCKEKAKQYLERRVLGSKHKCKVFERCKLDSSFYHTEQSNKKYVHKKYQLTWEHYSLTTIYLLFSFLHLRNKFYALIGLTRWLHVCTAQRSFLRMIY